MSKPPPFSLLESPNWSDYALLDSGDGLKLERFGAYTFVRPEVQAMWSRALPEKEWQQAHAVFQPTGEESGGHWEFKKKIEERWKMGYPLTIGPSTERRGDLRFWAMTTPGRHLGVFPECAANWDWVAGLIINREARTPAPAGGAGEERKENKKVSAVSHRRAAGLRGTNGVNSTRPGRNLEPLKAEDGRAGVRSVVKVLNLFGYTGLATLAAAATGAQVTHVDASKKAVAWARDNQALSGLAEKPVRWIVDDALKFVQREARRGNVYDGILLDPPKFGRGPKGEVWEVYKSLPRLLEACRQVLSETPLFVVVTVYAVKASAVHIGQALQEMMVPFNGNVGCGELVTREQSAGRLLSQAVFARWMAAMASQSNLT
jgi:23S rRNA (cytosine1962-C5)-methyltransferase